MPKVISIKRVKDAVYQYSHYSDNYGMDVVEIIPATHEVTLEFKDGGVSVGVTGNTNDLTFMTEKSDHDFYPLTTPNHVITKDMIKKHLEARRKMGQHPNIAAKELIEALTEYAPDIRFTAEAAEYISTFKDAMARKVISLSEVICGKYNLTH